MAAPTPCSPSVLIEPPGPDAVSWCEAAVLADQTIRLDWPDGAATDRYVIRRSVDGGPSYWRSRVSSDGAGGTLGYVDPLISVGSSYAFTVEAIGTDGSTTTATPCNPTPVVVEAPPVIPASSCTVSDQNGSFGLVWTYGDGASASDAIVERARDDIGVFGWRTRTNATTFVDSRVEPGFGYTYRVRMVADDERRSDPTICELG